MKFAQKLHKGFFEYEDNTFFRSINNFSWKNYNSFENNNINSVYTSKKLIFNNDTTFYNNSKKT